MQLDKKKACDELGVDEETFTELLKSFFSDADDEIVKLEKAIEVDNFEEIVRIGHTIKGLAGNYRVTPIQNLAETIEHLAKEGENNKQAIIEKCQEMKEGLKALRSN